MEDISLLPHIGGAESTLTFVFHKFAFLYPFDLEVWSKLAQQAHIKRIVYFDCDLQ